MKWKCLDCGTVFDEFRRMFEPHGEEAETCPYCGDDHAIIEVVPCVICDSEYADADYKVCEHCLGEVDNLIRFGEQKGLNYFLNSVYDDEVINSILKADLKETLGGNNAEHKKQMQNRIARFINDNKDDISDFLIMEDKNGLQ